MSNYMTAQELAEMIECEPTSYACMRRYLKRNGWPFEPNLRGFPQVSRDYHRARMHGMIEATNDSAFEPNMAAFR